MQMSGIVVFLAAIVASRIISERGYRNLDPDAKLRLMDGFSRTRSYAMIPLLFLIAGYWYLLDQTAIDKQYVTIAYFGLLVAYVIVRSILTQQKLAQLELPTEYRRMFTIAQIVSFLGVAWLFFAMFQDV